MSPVALPTGLLLLADAALGARPGSNDVLYTPAGEACVALGIRVHDLLVVSGAVPMLALRRPHRRPAARTG
ncbi:MAG: hypothetical protein NVSMB55_00020 [Mycobacteriales bacterium]